MLPPEQRRYSSLNLEQENCAIVDFLHQVIEARFEHAIQSQWKKFVTEYQVRICATFREKNLQQQRGNVSQEMRLFFQVIKMAACIALRDEGEDVSSYPGSIAALLRQATEQSVDEHQTIYDLLSRRQQQWIDGFSAEKKPRPHVSQKETIVVGEFPQEFLHNLTPKAMHSAIAFSYPTHRNRNER